MSGEMEVNEPVRVYDTSGPWGDPSVTLDPNKGFRPCAAIGSCSVATLKKSTAAAVGRMDNGYLSEDSCVRSETRR